MYQTIPITFLLANCREVVHFQSKSCENPKSLIMVFESFPLKVENVLYHLQAFLLYLKKYVVVILSN